MAGNLDRRVARTQKALHSALMTLILRKGYEAITVQDIIDEADVGRSTFYSHYSGKEDLLRSGFQMLRSELADVRRTARSQRSDEDLLGFSLVMFEHASGYKEIYRALVGRRGGVIAINEIRRVLSDIVKNDLPAVEEDAGVPREAYVQFVVGAFLTMLTWWLERRPRLTPAQVDAIFRRLVLKGIAPSSGDASRQG